MAYNQIEGKGLTAFVREISEGFKVINPLVLKKIPTESYKDIFQALGKIQRELRGEPFPSHDIQGIRNRNIRLQRIQTALTILQHTAKVKKVPLF